MFPSGNETLLLLILYLFIILKKKTFIYGWEGNLWKNNGEIIDLFSVLLKAFNSYWELPRIAKSFQVLKAKFNTPAFKSFNSSVLLESVEYC